MVHSNYKKILIFSVCVFLLLALLMLIVGRRNASKTPDNQEVNSTGAANSYWKTIGSKTFNPNSIKKEYKVGLITVKNTDIENRFRITFPDKARSDRKSWEKIAGIISAEAILQNEYVQSKKILVSNYDFNPRVANKARDYYNTAGTKFISGESFSIWFYNVTPPAIGVDAAKAKVRPIMEDLRSRVIAGNLTVKEASEEIKKIGELESIDSAYRSNSYGSFTQLKPVQKYFHDPDIDKSIWQMQSGQISEIITGKDSGTDGWYDAYFVVVKINSKLDSQLQSADEIVNQRIKEGMKINL